MNLPPALSIRQPWAWSIVYQGKDLENRSRSHSYRGRVLIHASAGMMEDERVSWYQFVQRQGLYTPEADLAFKTPERSFQRGGIIGVADMIDCVEESESPWWMGPRGYVLANARPLPFIPCRGTVAPMFWTVPIDVRDQVWDALEAVSSQAT